MRFQRPKLKIRTGIGNLPKMNKNSAIFFYFRKNAAEATATAILLNFKSDLPAEIFLAPKNE